MGRVKVSTSSKLSRKQLAARRKDKKTPPAPAARKVKKNRYRPGTVALRNIGPRSTDQGNADVPMLVTTAERKSPRLEKSMFLFAKSLFIDYDHHVLLERDLINKFSERYEQVSQEENKDNEMKKVIVFGENGVYIKPIFRYRNSSQRLIHQGKKNKSGIRKDCPEFKGYSASEACTLGSLTSIIDCIFGQQNQDRFSWNSLQQLKRQDNSNYLEIDFKPKPVVLLSGGEIGRSINDLSGHCNTIVVCKENDGTVSGWLKDCRTINQLTVPRLVVDFLNLIGCETLQIIPSVKSEFSPNCLLESVRFAAEVLDSTSHLELFKKYQQLTYLPKYHQFCTKEVHKKMNGGHIYGLLDMDLIGDLRRYLTTINDNYKKEVALKTGREYGKLTQKEKDILYKLVENAKNEYGLSTEERSRIAAKKKNDDLKKMNAPAKLVVKKKEALVVDGEAFYDVERIDDKRVLDGAVQYLIKWEGYNKRSWEPANKIMDDVPEQVNEFEQANATV